MKFIQLQAISSLVISTFSIGDGFVIQNRPIHGRSNNPFHYYDNRNQRNYKADQTNRNSTCKQSLNFVPEGMECTAMTTTTTTDVTSTIRPETPFDSTKLPFDTSITQDDTPLLFSSFYEYHLKFIKDHLTNLRPIDCTTHPSDVLSPKITTTTSDTGSFPNFDFTYNENLPKSARIYNQCYSSNEFRKIRTTYYDGGLKCQVFNALWYPQYDCDLPVLGIDLLAFGRRIRNKNDNGEETSNIQWKYLTIMDFQPVIPEDKDSITNTKDNTILFRDRSYEKDIMNPIRSKYPNLRGQASNRFYDSKEFFSSEMIYGRYENSDIVDKELFPAFCEYISAYTHLIQEDYQTQTLALNDNKSGYEYEPETRQQQIMEGQAAYDTYNAKRDPAKFMFEKMFGKDWADEFVHGFLFSNSEREQDNQTEHEERRQNYNTYSQQIKHSHVK